MVLSFCFAFFSSLSSSPTSLIFVFVVLFIVGRNAAQGQNIVQNLGNGNFDNDSTNDIDNDSTNEGGNLVWSSTGGGWRAMIADIGYANVFQQAGIFGENYNNFDTIATVSGGSWFSTQLFYSKKFYNQTVLAQSPKQVEEFVLRWMQTYYNISSDVSDETITKCNTSDVESDDADYDAENPPSQNLFDVCVLLEEFNHDWAYFIEQMLTAASTEYGDPDFTSMDMSPANRHTAMEQTDLCIQAALTPNSRIRYNGTTTTTGVYIGYDDGTGSTGSTNIFTVPLSFAIIVDNSGVSFEYGTDDITNPNDDKSGSGLYAYTAGNTPNDFSWNDWKPFYLFPGNGGKIIIDSTEILVGDQPLNKVGKFREPFRGAEKTTIVQAASVSSAAGGPYSSLNPSIYAHTFSTGDYAIEEARLATHWRVLAGLAIGLVVGVCIGYLPLVFLRRCGDDDEDDKKRDWVKIVIIALGVSFGIIAACLTGFFVGVGSILIPIAYNNGVERVYINPDFDAFAVCSQWPLSCGTQDSMIIDGWLVDNPAVVVNIAHHQKKHAFGNTTNSGPNNDTLKMIITNTNQKWEGDEWVHAQYAQYFSTDLNIGGPNPNPTTVTFNAVGIKLSSGRNPSSTPNFFPAIPVKKGISPGAHLWGPAYYSPYRSPQIFEEFVSFDDLDALVEPIEDSNMTTIRLSGTTINNPSFHVRAGQRVEILLLNLNEDITTLVVGKNNVAKYTQPLADMASHIVSNQELVDRVRNFVEA